MLSSSEEGGPLPAWAPGKPSGGGGRFECMEMRARWTKGPGGERQNEEGAQVCSGVIQD